MKFSQLTTIIGLASCAIAGLAVPQLTAMAKNHGNSIIKLTDLNYEDILNGQRDYHLIVYLSTESPLINCALCKEFKPGYERTATTWSHNYPNGLTAKQLAVENDPKPKNVYFASADFLDARKFFEVFALDNIPKVYYFPPTESTKANNFVGEMIEYRFFQGDHGQLLLNYINEVSGFKLKMYVPPNYTRMATNAFGAFTFVVLLRKFKKQVLAGFTSKILWSGLSLVAVLLLTTGYMFNQIRGSPYLKEHNNGKIEYFANSQQLQYGVETQILSFLYGFLSLFVIVLWKKAPTIKSPSVNFIAVTLFSALIFVAYSIYLSIFAKKGTGYPYQFVNFL